MPPFTFGESEKICMQERDEKEVWERITALESSYKSEHKRLDKMETVVDNIQQIVIEIRHIREDINGVSEKVDELENRPKKHYDTLITAIITAVASGIVGFVIAKIIGG